MFVISGITGGFIGGFVGFLMRPSFFDYKPPFSAVITRGATLEGLDEILVPIAQSAFNTMMFWAVLGGIIGVGAAYIRTRNSSTTTAK
ncbi:MAG: hypothetical protein WD468_00065 [Pirellulales bacterium]